MQICKGCHSHNTGTRYIDPQTVRSQASRHLMHHENYRGRVSLVMIVILLTSIIHEF